MSEANPAGDGERRAVEVHARTVDEAVARGLVRLGGLSRSEVRIEVIQEGKGGLLGFGSEDAIVRLTVLAPGERAEADLPPARPAPPAAPARPAASPAPQAPQAPPSEAAAATPLPEGRARPAPTAEAHPAEARAPKARTAGDEGAADEPEVAATEITRSLLEALGYPDVRIEREESLLPPEIDEEGSLVLCIRGPGTARLLADDAEALNALQFLVRLLVSRQAESWSNLLLDVDGDRARRMKELVGLAQQSADLVEREGRPVSLPPMTAYERRVVHLALRDHPSVATQSIGAGPTRKVTVRRKDQLLPDL